MENILQIQTTRSHISSYSTKSPAKVLIGLLITDLQVHEASPLAHKWIQRCSLENQKADRVKRLRHTSLVRGAEGARGAARRAPPSSRAGAEPPGACAAGAGRSPRGGEEVAALRGAGAVGAGARSLVL